MQQSPSMITLAIEVPTIFPTKLNALPLRITC